LVRGGRTVNPTEAAVVRRIFQEFAKGSSSLAIAKGLNNDCIPSPSGKRWGKSTLRGHHKAGNGLLRNELYIGRLVWNRQRFVRDPDTGKRVPRLNPQTEWVIQEVPDLRIIDDELWQRVKERLKAGYDSPASHKVRASGFWLMRRPKHLLSGLVRCGECGGAFAAVGRHYLACANARGKGTCTNRRAIPRLCLEDLILDGLKDRLMTPELVEEFARAFQVEVNRRRREHDRERENLVRELDKVSRQLDKLIEAIADGLSTNGLRVKLEGLEARKVEIEQAVAEAPSPMPRLHPNLAKLYRNKVQDLRAALSDGGAHDEALEILRGLGSVLN